MGIFGEKVTDDRVSLTIRSKATGRRETRLEARQPISFVCRSSYNMECPVLLSWSNENLKTGEVFLLSSHRRTEEDVQSYHLLCENITNTTKPWDKIGLNGEFSYHPLYWEWLEDILARCKTMLETFGIYRALHASRFLYGKCPNLIQAFCEYWCPETNSLHTSKGEVSISLLDICSMLELPVSGYLYDEVVPPRRELTSRLRPSCRHLLMAYHLICQEAKDRPTVELWTSFWYSGRSRYHFSSDADNGASIPCFGDKSFDNGEKPPGWAVFKTAFDRLGVVEGERTETCLAAFLSCWLCIFILPIKDQGYIRPGTFKIASEMANGKQYCLSTSILASVYRGLGELARSSNPGKRSQFPSHFLYAWIAKYFPAYNLDGQDPSSLRMEDYSGINRAYTFKLAAARKLIRSGMNFKWHSSIVQRNKETLEDDGTLSLDNFVHFASIRSSFMCYRCEDNFVMERYSPDRFGRQFGFHQDIPPNLNLTSIPDTGAMLSLHLACVRNGTGSRVLFPGSSISPGELVTGRFQEWWSRLFSGSSPKEPKEVTKRKRDGCFNPGAHKTQNSRLKVKIVRSGIPSIPIDTAVNDATLPIVIPGLQLDKPVTSTCDLHIRKEGLAATTASKGTASDVVEPLASEQVMEIPPKGADNILDVLTNIPSPSGCMGESGETNFQEALAHIPLPSGHYSFPSPARSSAFAADTWRENPNNDDEATSAGLPKAAPAPRFSHPERPPYNELSAFPANDIIIDAARRMGESIIDKLSRTKLDQLYRLVHDFDGIYYTLTQMGFEVSPLKNKVDKVIRLACDLKPLQEGSLLGVTVQERDRRLAMAKEKLKVIALQLAVKTSRLQSISTGLAKAKSSHEEALRQLGYWEAQIKDLESHHSAEMKQVDVIKERATAQQEQVNIEEATKVIDPRAQEAFEAAMAYAAGVFEDAKEFRWEPSLL